MEVFLEEPPNRRRALDPKRKSALGRATQHFGLEFSDGDDERMATTSSTDLTLLVKVEGKKGVLKLASGVFSVFPVSSKGSSVQAQVIYPPGFIHVS